MTTNMQYIFCDIDATLADDRHRHQILMDSIEFCQAAGTRNGKVELFDIHRMAGLPEAPITDVISATFFDFFHEVGVVDDPIHSVIREVQRLQEEHPEARLVAFTARPERFREVTQAFLDRLDIQFDELIMRRNDDFRRSGEMKVRVLTDDMGLTPEDVIDFLDDTPAVIEALQAEGFNASLVARLPQEKRHGDLHDLGISGR